MQPPSSLPTHSHLSVCVVLQITPQQQPTSIVQLDNGIQLAKVRRAVSKTCVGAASNCATSSSLSSCHLNLLDTPTTSVAPMCKSKQGLVSSDEAAVMLAQPELEASDLVPNQYEGGWIEGVCLCLCVCVHVAEGCGLHVWAESKQEAQVVAQHERLTCR